MRKLLSLVAVVGLFTVVTAMPAAADQPVVFQFGGVDSDTDPCTGEAMSVDLLFTVAAHEHRNNTVWVIDSYGETSNGYIGQGHETQVTNLDKWVSVFNWVVVNPDTDARFIIKGRFLIDLESGDAQHAGVELTCVGHAV